MKDLKKWIAHIPMTIKEMFSLVILQIINKNLALAILHLIVKDKIYFYLNKLDVVIIKDNKEFIFDVEDFEFEIEENKILTQQELRQLIVSEIIKYIKEKIN